MSIFGRNDRDKPQENEQPTRCRDHRPSPCRHDNYGPCGEPLPDSPTNPLTCPGGAVCFNCGVR